MCLAVNCYVIALMIVNFDLKSCLQFDGFGVFNMLISGLLSICP